MARPALIKEVDVSALLHLRAEGFSNKEIAEQLDVSPITIARYIGKNPPEITSRIRREVRFDVLDRAEKMRGDTKRRITMDKPSFERTDTPDAVQGETVLTVKSRTVSLDGGSGLSYSVMNSEVRIFRGEHFITASVDDLHRIALELLTI